MAIDHGVYAGVSTEFDWAAFKKDMEEAKKEWYSLSGYAKMWIGLPFGGQSLPAKEVMLMVTYENLFQFALVLVGVVSIYASVWRKK